MVEYRSWKRDLSPCLITFSFSVKDFLVSTNTKKSQKLLLDEISMKNEIENRWWKGPFLKSHT